jgi:outer membrane protein assembly factor BamB
MSIPSVWLDTRIYPASRPLQMSARHLSDWLSYNVPGKRKHSCYSLRAREGSSVKRLLLRLLFVACVVSLSGCATSTPHPTSSSAPVFYVASLENSATQIPNLLSAIDAATGKPLWRFRLASFNITTAVPDRDVIYAGVTNQNVYALGKGSGRVHWQAHVDGFPRRGGPGEV